MRIRFDAFVYDSEVRALTRDELERPLSPKAFQLLGLLLERRPRAASHEELRDALWPDSNVARTSLARLVTEIRKVLGDDAQAARYVRNVHGFGYSFCGSANETQPLRLDEVMPPCSLLWGERCVALSEGENVIGRTADCRIAIDSPQVSRRHARVFVAAGQATVEDLGSKNGTFVGARRIERPTRLENGDKLIVGPALLLFRGGADAAATKTST